MLITIQLTALIFFIPEAKESTPRITSSPAVRNLFETRAAEHTKDSAIAVPAAQNSDQDVQPQKDSDESSPSGKSGPSESAGPSEYAGSTESDTHSDTPHDAHTGGSVRRYTPRVPPLK